MCGIYGIIANQNSSKLYFFKDLETIVKKIFQESLSRGSEAAGLLISTNNHASMIKTSKKITKFLKSVDYLSLKKHNQNEPIKIVFGHTRMSTHGDPNNAINNQPVVSKAQKIIGIHNGLITNHQELIEDKKNIAELDTQNLLNYLEEQLPTTINDEKLKKIFHKLENQIKGVANLALFLPKNNLFLLYSNNGSLYYVKANGLTYFASEKSTLEKTLQKQAKQIKNKLIIFKFSGKNQIRIDYLSSKNKQFLTKKTNFCNKLNLLKKHTINETTIKKLKRCTQCILPSTTPFITFDKCGVCNFCLEHKPITYQGETALEKILSQHRRSDGQPDCLVAFSGGRDSSYGLHLLKTKFRMNPVAFTYDWGMISDLGRRNQARMLGKLGVEQILVSANISQKRAHIRSNILAWCEKPDLGMVPIFMQGDKQCEYYTDQAAKKYKIPLIIYCRGNELEREEFKAGYCGIKNADPGGIIHNLPVVDKLRLLTYYGKQYLLNPSYFNHSILDTAFGYFSTYLAPHNYLNLWHYVPWKEKEIIKTLTKNYGWEMSADTPTSWRIGDGTPAFYNYIYYQVQGFTENDSLRARQVREGFLSREKALELVMAENKPQYNNLKWYFDTLNLDGNAVLTVVDKMEKRY